LAKRLSYAKHEKTHDDSSNNDYDQQHHNCFYSLSTLSMTQTFCQACYLSPHWQGDVVEHAQS